MTGGCWLDRGTAGLPPQAEVWMVSHRKTWEKRASREDSKGKGPGLG